jgi:hypothetical protein
LVRQLWLLGAADQRLLDGFLEACHCNTVPVGSITTGQGKPDL